MTNGATVKQYMAADHSINPKPEMTVRRDRKLEPTLLTKYDLAASTTSQKRYIERKALQKKKRTKTTYYSNLKRSQGTLH